MSTIKTWQERAKIVMQTETIGSDTRAGIKSRCMAEEIAELRAALAASGGNAAPELPKITRYSIYEDHGRANMMDDDDGDYVHILDHTEQMTAYGKACAQSGPNAALVAALRKIKQNETEVFDEAMGEMVIVGLDAEEMVAIAADALSAAGQEVGK